MNVCNAKRGIAVVTCPSVCNVDVAYRGHFNVGLREKTKKSTQK